MNKFTGNVFYVRIERLYGLFTLAFALVVFAPDTSFANGTRLSAQACDSMKQSVIATSVPDGSSATTALEIVMFMTKTTIDMIDGGCPTEPGTTQADIDAERIKRLQDYTTAEQNCNSLQSGGGDACHRFALRAQF